MDIDSVLNNLYRIRFSNKEIEQRNIIWKALCGCFLQKYIDEESHTVLDIGAGYGEFINNIRCKEKLAVDFNQDTPHYLKPGVRFFKYPSAKLSFLEDSSVDIVFLSNFSEHLKSKDELIETLLEVRRILRPQGKLMILGPNIRYVYSEYWDFFDHYIPLSHKGLRELLMALGFNIELILPKFLPYTTKSKIPKNYLAVKIYLKLPWLWRIMGKQMFIVAKK